MDQSEKLFAPERKNTSPAKNGRTAFYRFLCENKAYILAFLLPFGLIAVCFALSGVYPFGDEQFINYDGWHQYYPFLLELWDHLKEGTSLLYDRSMGMGTNFLSMLSYYGASPLNLLIVLAPEREFRVLFMLLVAVRIGLAGLFTSIFLGRVFRRKDLSIAFFGCAYALCGYMVGYSWNVMWLDSVMLYPLLCLGTVLLYREGKFKLYIISLFLSLFSNYYIGYMSCVFTVFVFFLLWIIDKTPWRKIGEKILRFFVCSLIGGGMAAVLLLPAYFGLQNTYSTTGSFPNYLISYESLSDIAAGLSPLHDPAVIDGLPNIYTTVIVALFAVMFLWAKRIPFREKIAGLLTLVFLVAGFNLSIPNYIWHGFHFTNMIPYRFAFLFSFALIVMAYRYYTKGIAGMDAIDVVGMLSFAAVIAFCTYPLYGMKSTLAVVLISCVVMFFSALVSHGMIGKRFFAALCAVILFSECALSAYMGVRATGTTSYSGYYDGKTGEEIFALVETAKEKEAEEGAEKQFSRLEVTEWRSLNDSCFYGYNGVSQFASSANVHLSSFLEEMGLGADAGSNRFTYVHTSPLVNTLLGIKYLIAKNGFLSDSDTKRISQAQNDFTAALYEYEGYIAPGFMMNGAAKDFVMPEGVAPFEKQNALFRAVTGLEGNLFSPMLPDGESHANLVASLENGITSYTVTANDQENTYIKYDYTAPADGMIYVWADIADGDYVLVNNAWHTVEYPNFFSAGYFREGESFSLRADIAENAEAGFESSAVLYPCAIDTALWERGLEILSASPFLAEEWEETHILGSVEAAEDGYFYLSIPYEKGWKITVDGEEREVVPLAGALLGIELEKGAHTVELCYSPEGYGIGGVITLLSLALFFFLCLWERKKGAPVFTEEKTAFSYEETVFFDPAPIEKQEEQKEVLAEK